MQGTLYRQSSLPTAGPRHSHAHTLATPYFTAIKCYNLPISASALHSHQQSRAMRSSKSKRRYVTHGERILISCLDQLLNTGHPQHLADKATTPKTHCDCTLELNQQPCLGLVKNSILEWITVKPDFLQQVIPAWWFLVKYVCHG